MNDPRDLPELVRAALVGVSACPPSGTGLDGVLPEGPPEVTLLRRAGLVELARRAASPAASPLPLPEPDDAPEVRALASPLLVALVSYALKPPGKLVELHREMFTALAERGLRLPLELAPRLLTDPRLRDHPDVAALVGARAAWLSRFVPPHPVRKKKPPELPPDEAWTGPPTPPLLDALRVLPRPFPAPISALAAAWLAPFRHGEEIQRSLVAPAIKSIALGLRPEHLGVLLGRAPMFYRHHREALTIAETRRRFWEELTRVVPVCNAPA